jgi:hypothetical protein
MKLSGEVKRSVQRAKKAIETRDKIKAALAEAFRLQADAETHVQKVIEGLGEAEADAAINGTASVDSGDLISGARTACDVLSARVSGLNRKLAGMEAEINAAADELESARNTFEDECLNEYRGQLAKAAGEFASVLAQGAALADAFGRSWLDMAIREISIRDFFNPSSRFLIDMHKPHETWRGDATAEAIYAALSEPKMVANSLR